MIKIFRAYLAILYFIGCSHIILECTLPIQYAVWGFITLVGSIIILGGND